MAQLVAIARARGNRRRPKAGSRATHSGRRMLFYRAGTRATHSESRFTDGLRENIRMPDQVAARETVDAVYRAESRAVLATLIRLLGDFDLAEEALHEAFRAALEQWPREGVPDQPRAWLVSAGRFKAIDAIRRQSRFLPLDPEQHD